MRERGQAAILYIMILVLVALVALIIFTLIGQATIDRVTKTGRSSAIDIAGEPKPVQIGIDLTRANDMELTAVQCSDVFPWVIEPSYHLGERVATDAKRLTAWAALKFCNDLRVWYCPKYVPQQDTQEIGLAWPEYILECQGADNVTCAVGVVLASPTDGLPAGVRLGVTAYTTECARHWQQMSRRGCFPVQLTFAFP